MERHFHHGQVVRDIQRPSEEASARISQHDAAKVGDSMGHHGIMHHALKPIREGMRLCGPAVTVVTTPGDSLYVAHAADIAQPGDVIVIDAGGSEDVAVIGDRIGYYMSEKRHLAGLVVDGAVRDVHGLRKLGMPTFTRAISPRIFGSNGPGAINVPISCGGVPVYPGDLILGDDDGVVVVPRDDVERIADLADLHLAGELERLDRVNRDEKLTTVQNLGPRLAAWLE